MWTAVTLALIFLAPIVAHAKPPTAQCVAQCDLGYVPECVVATTPTPVPTATAVPPTPTRTVTAVPPTPPPPTVVPPTPTRVPTPPVTGRLHGVHDDMTANGPSWHDTWTASIALLHPRVVRSRMSWSMIE